MKIVFVALLSTYLLAFAAGNEPERHKLKLDISDLLNRDVLWQLTPETLEKRLSSPGFSENPFLQWIGGEKSMGRLERQPFANVSVDLTVHDGALAVSEAVIRFRAGKSASLACTVITPTEVAETALRSYLLGLMGKEPSRVMRATCGWKEQLGATQELWESGEEQVLLECNHQLSRVIFCKDLTDAGQILPKRAERKEHKDQFFVRLDDLVFPARFGNFSIEEFARTFGATLEDKQSPYFSWTTGARDGARFARKLFSNTQHDIFLFGDAVKAEEVVAKFRDGQLVRVTASILNTGDTGKIEKAKFDACFKATGSALNKLMGTTAKPLGSAGRNPAKALGWVWTNARAIAVLDCNPAAMKGDVEFLRLRMGGLTEKNDLLGITAVGQTAGARDKAALRSAVQRDGGSGQVIISGVPMVDQGQKGYCVAASCQRLFNYMGIQCDQHELASMLDTTAQDGTNLATMYLALAKVDSKYGTRFRAVKARLLFPGIDRREYERRQKQPLLKVVKEYVDNGTPLLWALDLGRAPQDPKLPQQGGGHMRLIIGYNEKTAEVLYSDSWGAGHEKKSMLLTAAEACTDAIFVMEPRR